MRRRSTRPLIRAIPAIVALAALVAAGARGYFFGRRLAPEDLEGEQEYGRKYVHLRRLFVFIERSIDQALQWAVFEPEAACRRRAARRR